MHELKGRYETPNASKYLQQLCKHFGHKIDVEYDETKGTAQFVFGPAHFDANESELLVSFELIDEAAVESAKHVIDSHLKKFAFREDFEHMNWQ